MKEVLAVPEENLEAVIAVIRAGLLHTEEYETLSDDIRAALENWCDEEEAYLRRLEEE